MDDFVTIATYDDYLTAHLDKLRLEDAGVYCYVADENTVTAKWILKNAIGGIKLRVPESVKEKAEQILAQRTEETKVDYELVEGGELRCPGCGSNNTRTEKYSQSMIGWSWLLLGFPIPVNVVKNHRCFYCGHKWQS